MLLLISYHASKLFWHLNEFYFHFSKSTEVKCNRLMQRRDEHWYEHWISLFLSLWLAPLVASTPKLESMLLWLLWDFTFHDLFQHDVGTLQSLRRLFLSFNEIKRYVWFKYLDIFARFSTIEQAQTVNKCSSLISTIYTSHK